MIQHIVLLKLPESVLGDPLNKVIEATKLLQTKIPGLLDVAQGVNLSDRSKGYNVGLTMIFESREALESFGPHPAHQAIIQTIKAMGLVDLLVIDFER